VTRIIAIAAPPGAGKSSLARALAQQLDNAAVIYFDHYQMATEKPVDEIMDWMKSGADFNDFDIPYLARDLGLLKQGDSISDPISGESIEATSHILFEMPFGREHSQSAAFIDYLLWIDVPLDVALARKVSEFTQDYIAANEPDSCQQYIEWQAQYLNHYLGGIRQTLDIQRLRISKDADMILDGMLSVKNMAQQALEAIKGIG